MNNRPKRSVRLLHCPMPTISPFIWRAAAVAPPLLVPACTVIGGAA